MYIIFISVKLSHGGTLCTTMLLSYIFFALSLCFSPRELDEKRKDHERPTWSYKVNCLNSFENCILYDINLLLWTKILLSQIKCVAPWLQNSGTTDFSFFFLAHLFMSNIDFMIFLYGGVAWLSYFQIFWPYNNLYSTFVLDFNNVLVSIFCTCKLESLLQTII